ncbi:MAG: DMT family transporter [Oceanococcus sp.]
MGLGEFFSLACALAWAVAVILSKKAGEHMPPFALNLFKNVLMVALMVPTILLVEGLSFPQIPVQAVCWALFSGVLGIGLGDTVFFRSLNMLGASRSGVAGTMYSPWVVLLSSVFLGQSLVSWQWAGMALVIAGVVMASWPKAHDGSGLSAQQLRLGFAWAALAMFLMALGIVTAKPLLEQYSFVWVVMLRMLGGLGFMLLLILFRRNGAELVQQFRRPHHWPTLFAAAFIGTYVAMLMWLAGYKYATAAVAAVLNESAAIATLLLARYWLKESLSKRQVFGAAASIAGVVLVVLI